MIVVENKSRAVISLHAVKKRHPSISFPRVPSEEVLESLGYSLVNLVEPPIGDVVETGAPELREDGKWYQTWAVRQFTGGELAQRLEDRRNELLAAVTARRWEIETGGITLPNGVRVATAIEDQNRLTSVVANARLAGVETVDYKAASGWVTLTVDELESVAAAIALHVQACFSAERAHHQAIELLDEQGMASYHIDTGWPPNASETPT